VRAALLEVRSELVQIRRQGAALRRDLVGATSIRVVAQSPAWRARRRPRVSVVVALHEDVPQIGDTLDSVAGSWMREFELIVVDAGSHDGSLAIAERWLGEHPRIPATLIDDHDAQGRGAARNTALDFARGDAILVLDPGGAIYSHCLQRLADTLASMDAVAFVYPMIEVSVESDWFVRAGGDNLLNVFGWEPERLRSGNFIHAPYLVRLGTLRKLSGFTPDPALDGFEDYDLWCRIAEQGWRGQQLAQLLARRAEIPSSSCLSTVHPAPGPGTRALMSRAPRAMAGAFTR
jgi:hypothetical protein